MPFLPPGIVGNPGPNVTGHGLPLLAPAAKGPTSEEVGPIRFGAFCRKAYAFAPAFLRLEATASPPMPRASRRPRLTVVEASGTGAATSP